MRVVIVLEQRFDRTPNGTVWAPVTFSYPFWQRYLEVFHAVRVVARVRAVTSVPADFRQASGDNVDFVEVPYYVGPTQFMQVAPRVIRAVQSSVRPEDAVILRIGSVLATVMHPTLMRAGHPYGVEVVGDPYNVFAPGAVQYPLRPLLRSFFTWAQKRQCAGACGAAYVTRRALQRRYPCIAHEAGISDVELVESATITHDGKLSTHYSSIQLDQSGYAWTERLNIVTSRRLHLITVGSLEQLYKAPDTLIRAVAECVGNGLDLGLVIVGGGRYLAALKSLSAGLGIADRVHFTGALPGGEVIQRQLDAADLFVLPSRTEGLPRAMIEAMARGLPCIGSTVGGIPELLPVEDMVPPDDTEALACKIREVITNPTRMEEMSARNREKATEYSADVLRKRRIEFYCWVLRKTEDWYDRRQSATGRSNESLAPR